jgi:uncharacterized protein (DUF2141 family)
MFKSPAARSFWVRLSLVMVAMVVMVGAEGVATGLDEPPLVDEVEIPEPGAKLVIRFTNVPSATVTVVATLFSSEETFLTADAAYESTADPAGDGTATIILEDVVPGSYGLVVFADEDGDLHQTFSMRIFPAEYYGFGNNATGLFGPPSFSDTVVTVSMPMTETDLRLHAPPFGGLW